MIEFQCDQDCHDLLEDTLEDYKIKRVKRAKNKPAHHLCDQPVERNQNDEGDDERQDEGDRAFEPLIECLGRPLPSRQTPP